MLDALKALGSGFVLFILARLVFVGVVGIVVGTVVEMVGVCRCRLAVRRREAVARGEEAR